MSRSPFDPREVDVTADELGAGDELSGVAGRLDEYARETAAVEPPPHFSARVMSALPEGPVRGGLFGVFGGALRALRAAPLAGVLVLLVGFGGVLAVGQVTGAFRILPVSSPPPSVVPLPTSTNGPAPSLDPSGGPSASPDQSPSPDASASPSQEPSSSASPSLSPESSIDASPVLAP